MLRPSGDAGPAAVGEAAAFTWLESLERRVLLSGGFVSHGFVAGGQIVGPVGGFESSGLFLPPQHSLIQYGKLLSAPARGKPLNAALQYLAAHASEMGLTAADVANPIVTDQYTDADTGQTHIYLRQRVRGLEVSNANIAISLTRDNRVISAAGGFVAGASASSAATGQPDPAKPGRDAVRALRDAAGKFGLRLGANPRVLKSVANARRDTVIRSSDASLDDIPAKLQYIATDQGLKLTWSLVLRTPDNDHWYNADIDTASGAIVANTDWIEHLESYNVYAQPTKAPNDGSRSIVTDPADPTYSPFGWHDNGVAGAEFIDTRGNNVFAQDDTDANNTGGTRPSGGSSLNFNFSLNLAQAPSTYLSAAITNAYYWNNLLHDIHAHYGFTEAAGNFQLTNYSGQGAAGDPVQADVQDGAKINNADFGTPPDGQLPRMQMYLFNITSPNRDGDLDATVMVHEYGHGVSNRLTGGPANANALINIQSAGMGEGWSDFYALMLTQKPTDAQNDAYPIGTYVIGQSTTGGGIRRFPYSYNMSTDPLTFAYYGAGGDVEVHDTGELWTSTLWDLNWLLIQKYGASADITHGYNPAVSGQNGGNNLVLKLVMDAMKLQPANPSFTQARDAILSADVALTGGANQLQIWTAFARRGLGFSAVDSSSNAAIVTTAFDVPPGVINPRVDSSTPIGLQTSPVNHVDFTFSQAMNPASFSVASDVSAFTGPGAVNLLDQITGSSWLNGNTTLRVSFNAPSADGQYTMTIGPQILSASDGHAMDQNQSGTAGEAGDAYTAQFAYDSVVMQVVATSPANGALAPVPLTTLDVTFNENYDPATVGTNDLVLSQGTVTNAAPLNATTVRYTLSGLTSEGALTLSIAAGALTDTLGSPMTAYSGSLALDAAGTLAFPALTAQNPAGSTVYAGSISGNIGTAADTDTFSINLDAGQTLSVAIAPTTGGLRPAVDLLDSSNATLASASAASAGKEAVIQSFALPAGGAYTLRVASLSGTTDSYAVLVYLNSALESEEHTGPLDDTRATAQDLDAAAHNLGGSASIATVAGTLHPSAALTLASEDFESGTLGPAWSTYSSDANGRLQVTPTFGAAGGTKALWMDRAVSGGFTLNEAVWTVNLSGVSQATLNFSHAEYLDEEDVFSGSFADHFNADGVAISADGVNWKPLWNAANQTTSGTWQAYNFDLAAAAQAAGISLGANFKIKFQQYDNTPLTGDGRGWDSLSITTPLASADTADYYAFTLSAGQAATLALARQGGSAGLAVSLLDSTGADVVAGASGATNLDWATNYVAPAAGTYYAKVTGPLSTAYQLVLTRGAAFDIESNDTIATAQIIDPSRVVAGAISGNDDYFRFAATAGQVLRLSTATPGDGAGEFVNSLSPMLDLYDPAGAPLVSNDNGAADGRNALLTYSVLTSGNYTARVSAASGTGEYVLTVADISSPAPASPDLLAAADSAALPTDNVTSFNNASPAAALQFSVPGTIAGATVTLLLNGNPIGSAVAAGSTTDITTAPIVGTIGNASYTVTARQALAGHVDSPDSPGLGLTIDAAAPTATITPVSPSLRFTPVDSVAITLSEPIPALALSDFTLTRNGGVIPLTAAQTISTSDGGTTWTLGNLAAITTAPGDYLLSLLPAGVADLAGNALASGASTSFTVSATAPTLLAAVSRLTHGPGATPYDVVLPLAGNSGIEPRILFSSWSLVLTFDKAISQVAVAEVTAGTGTAGTPTFSGNSVIVPMSGAVNAESLTLALTDVASSDGGLLASAAVTLRLLRGDINGDGAINVSDINLAKSVGGVPITLANFRKDVNADGAVNVSDINLVKSVGGTSVTGGPSGDAIPTVSPISDQVLTQDHSTAPLDFTIGDAETDPAALYVGASSDNLILLPDATSYAFAGTGAARTLTITPAAGQTGSAIITLLVSDGESARRVTFNLTVNV